MRSVRQETDLLVWKDIKGGVLLKSIIAVGDLIS